MEKCAAEVVEEADPSRTEMETGEVDCRSFHVRNSKWPQWHTLFFEGQVAVDIRWSARRT